MAAHKEYRRKIQKTGGVSLSITLPKEWTEAHNLHAGDELRCRQTDQGELCISPVDSESKPREIITTIQLDEPLEENLLIRQIVAAYLSGYTTIRLYGPQGISSQVRQLIQGKTSDFIGCEVMESSSKEMVLRDLASPGSLKISLFFKRLSKLVIQMFTLTLNGVFNQKKDDLEEVILTEPTVDKLYYLISRLLRMVLSDASLSTFLEVQLSTVIDLERIAKRLEGIADHCKHFAAELLELGLDPIYLVETRDLNRLESQSKQVARILEEIIEAFFSRDVRQANELIERSHALRAQFEVQIAEDAGKLMVPLLIQIATILERVSSYVADIGEAILNMSI